MATSAQQVIAAGPPAGVRSPSSSSSSSESKTHAGVAGQTQPDALANGETVAGLAAGSHTVQPPNSPGSSTGAAAASSRRASFLKFKARAVMVLEALNLHNRNRATLEGRIKKEKKRRLRAVQEGGCCSGSRPAVFGVIMWILAGSIFFHFANGWEWSNSFFYAVDTGLSIGFGAFPEGVFTFTCANNTLVKESFKPWQGSMAYTVIHVFAGASAVAGALGLFVSVALERQDTMREDAEKDFESSKIKIKYSKKQKARDAVLGCYTRNKTRVNCFTALFVWLSFGVIYGTVYEEWTFIQSVYYAVTSVSTAGLQPPRGTTFAMLFTGVFCLFGVPLWGLALSQLAGILVEQYMMNQQKKQLEARFSLAEFEYAKKLGSSGTSQVDWASYLQMTLTRMGVVDDQLISSINEQFQFLDFDGTGTIEPLEMDAMFCFREHDWDKSGMIDFDEFSDAAVALDLKYKGKAGLDISEEGLRKQYNEVDADSSGVIGKEEFMAWFRSHTPEAKKALEMLISSANAKTMPAEAQAWKQKNSPKRAKSSRSADNRHGHSVHSGLASSKIAPSPSEDSG